MEITEIQLKKTNTGTNMKAIASVIFDESFIINGIRVIDNGEKLFVAMPSKIKTDGSFMDIAHPVNQAMRQKIEGAILEDYHQRI